MAQLPGDQVHGQDDDNNTNSLFESDSDDESLRPTLRRRPKKKTLPRNEPRTPDEGSTKRWKRVVGPGLTRNYPGAVLWAISPGRLYTNPNLLSIDHVNDTRFYLSSYDSDMLQNSILRDEQTSTGLMPVPASPQDQPEQQQNQPQRAQQLVLTSVQEGAALWRDGASTSTYPRRTFARMQYASYQPDSTGPGFWLDGPDTNRFYEHLTNNPDQFPFAPPPVVPSPVSGQLGSLAIRWMSLLGAHNRKPQEGYGGPAIHGTPQQFQYAIRNGVDPRQYAAAYAGAWQGPPLDQVNYDSAMAGPSNIDEDDYETDDPDFRDGQYYQGDQNEQDDETEENSNGDEDAQDEDEVDFDRTTTQAQWGEGKTFHKKWEIYRDNYPDSEAKTCIRCKINRYRCSYKEKHFPCDRCKQDGQVCVRQFWDENTRVRGNPPKLCRSGKTASVKAPAAKKKQGAATIAQAPIPAKLSLRQLGFDPRCDRCRLYNLSCEVERPCQACEDASANCTNTNQGQPFQEHAPDWGGVGDDSEMHKFDDDFNFDLELQSILYPPSPPGSLQNIATSIAAGAQPSGSSSIPGFQVALSGRSSRPQIGGLPLLSRPMAGQKRHSPDKEADDSAGAAITNRPTKKPRTKKQKGTTAAKITKAAGNAKAQSQVNGYELPNNMNDPSLMEGDPMVLDQPLPPARQQPPALLASDWRIYGLPTKPRLFSTRTGGPDNNEEKCRQDLNFWRSATDVQEFPPYCNRGPTKTCDFLSDTAGWIDKICHDTQETAVRLLEQAVISSSKLFVCWNCYPDLQQNEGGNVHQQVCQCAWQMTRTWLCNSHRNTARERFATQVGTAKQKLIENDDLDICPVCKTYQPEETNAWVCCACRSKVYRNPLVPD